MSKDQPSPSGSDIEKNDGDLKNTEASIDEAPSEQAGDAFEGYVIDRAMEKKMLRKFDVIILREYVNRLNVKQY